MITAKPHNRQFTVTDVRGVPLSLVCYTRSLELCARMNYETEVLDFIDCIPAGEVLYDLGACEGRFALYAAKRGVRCYAFEPEAANFQAFQENLALNPDAAGNLTPINAAVGSYTGKATLNIGQPWAGGHHKTVGAQAERADLAFEAVNEQEINIVALDEYIRTAKLPWPNYLKIDVDGSEVPVLEGAGQTLRRPELKAVIFELFKADKSYGEAVSRLEAAGFQPERTIKFPTRRIYITSSSVVLGRLEEAGRESTKNAAGRQSTTSGIIVCCTNRESDALFDLKPIRHHQRHRLAHYHA